MSIAGRLEVQALGGSVEGQTSQPVPEWNSSRTCKVQSGKLLLRVLAYLEIRQSHDKGEFQAVRTVSSISFLQVWKIQPCRIGQSPLSNRGELANRTKDQQSSHDFELLVSRIIISLALENVFILQKEAENFSTWLLLQAKSSYQEPPDSQFLPLMNYVTLDKAHLPH